MRKNFNEEHLNDCINHFRYDMDVYQYLLNIDKEDRTENENKYVRYCYHYEEGLAGML